MTIKNGKGFPKYLAEYKKSQIIGFLVIFTSSWLVFTPLLSNTCSYQNIICLECIDPAISVTTFAVAIFLGAYAWRKDWLDSLEKSLTVRFWWDGEVRMVGYRAWLPHESDVRNWGQSIGGQLNMNYFLFFHSYPDLKINTRSQKNRPEKDEHSNKLFNHYLYDVYLTRKPEALMTNEDRSKYDIPKVDISKAYFPPPSGIIIMIEPENKLIHAESIMKMPIFICSDPTEKNEDNLEFISVESVGDGRSKPTYWVLDNHNPTDIEKRRLIGALRYSSIDIQ